MTHQTHCLVCTIASLIAASIACTSSARALETRVAIQGEITNVSDTNNWFDNSFQVGMLVGGTYNHFDIGYQRQNSPPSSFYRYFLEANAFGLPVLPVSMNIETGGQAYSTAPGVFFYGINVIDDSDGSGFDPAGDSYLVQSPLAFPANFTDLSGDPVLDPDGLFFPIMGMSLRLIDSSGTAFSSTELPLSAPNLSSFSSAIGTIFIADGNGEPNYASMEFRITSLQLIPEPATLSVLGAIGAVTLKRHRSRNTPDSIQAAAQ